MNEGMAGNKKAKISFHVIETIYIILLVLSLVAGFILDLIAKSGHPIIIVSDLRNFSLVVLQIQATVSTLIVALIALLSGTINEDVYGISITQYYMQIRPHALKQQYVVPLSISLVILGVMLELFEFYNLVFSVLICEWTLIIFSVISLIPVFSGRRNWKPEIQSYLINNIQSTPSLNYKLIIAFLNSCKDSVNRYDWDDRYEILWITLECLLKSNETQSFTIINTEWCDMIRAHLRHNESWIVKRGMKLLNDSYDRIWLHICKCDTTAIGTTGSPKIFDALFDDCRLSLEHLSIQELEECFNFEWLSETIARVESYYQKESPDRFNSVCQTLESFFRFMVILLTEKTTEIPLSSYDKNYWGKALKEQHISNYNLPKENLDIYLIHRCKLYLGYTIYMIKYGQLDLLKKFYLDGSLYIVYDNKYLLIYHLAIACYLFYVSELENPHLIPQEAKDCSDYLLASDAFRSRFTSVLTRGKWESEIDFFQNNCETLLKELLYQYEFMKSGQAKLLIIDSAVEIFYAFVQCYISDCQYNVSFSTGDFQHLRGQMIRYLQDEQREQTKILFQKLYQALIAFNRTFNAIEKADALFYKWESRMLKSFKQEMIAKAVSAQKSYVENSIESVLQADTKRQLLDYFQDRFGCIIEQALIDGQEFYVELLNFTADTEEFLSKKTLCDIYDYLGGSLINCLASILYRNKLVVLYDRSKHNDSEFIENMRADRINLLLGSEHVLLSSDHRNWSTIKAFRNECECVFFGNASVALALHKDALRVAIRDISVHIRNTSVDEDCDVQFIKETGEYRIGLINSIAASFSKDEAEQYIKNQKKVAVVGVTIGIQTSEKEIGFMITKNNGNQ